MKKLIFLILIAFPFFCVSQNVIQLHRKDGRPKDEIIKRLKDVKILTKDSHIVKGWISEIKDSSFDIVYIDKTIEIPINNIIILFCRKNMVGNGIAGIGFSILTAYAIYGTISMIGTGFGLIAGVLYIPVPLIGSIYFLTHRKKYDLQSKYDLKTVKAQ